MTFLSEQVERFRGFRRRLHDERGLTLIELMVATFLFALISAGVVLAMGSGFGLMRNNRNRSVAANLASAEMDAVRAADFASLPLGETISSRAVDGVAYSIRRSSEWISEDAEGGACDTPSGTQLAFMRVAVQVSWPNMAGAEPVRSDTLLTPPVGAYDPSSGHISVKVFDRDAFPASGHRVTITGPAGTRNQNTADGCAFFAYLTPGTYTVSLGTVGYVDGQGLNTPTQTVGVNVGTISSVQFNYDEASQLALTLGDTAGYPAPSNVTVTIANTALVPIGTKVITGTGSPRTVGNLFPYPSGFFAWSGSCPDSDPEATADGTPVHPGATRGAAHAVEPGQTTAGIVDMHEVDVTVTNSTGIQSGRTVTAVNVAGGCDGPGTYTLGVTDAVGKVSASVPFGTWRFEVSGASPQGGWPSVKLSPGNATPTPVSAVIQ